MNKIIECVPNFSEGRDAGKIAKIAGEIEKVKDVKLLNVESDINRLEHHGLDRCPDKGLNAFKRYCALGVLAANPR